MDMDIANELVQDPIPEFLAADLLLDQHLFKALKAAPHPMQDYAAFAVRWPYSAAELQQAHDWMMRWGQTPGAKAGRWVDPLGREYTAPAGNFTPGQVKPNGSCLLHYVEMVE